MTGLEPFLRRAQVIRDRVARRRRRRSEEDVEREEEPYRRERPAHPSGSAPRGTGCADLAGQERDRGRSARERHGDEHRAPERVDVPEHEDERREEDVADGEDRQPPPQTVPYDQPAARSEEPSAAVRRRDHGRCSEKRHRAASIARNLLPHV